ncbi:hypothetical protein [Brumimicrobium mesophilum]|uniref:hypothetical protein n=1 Tax=Brumimicrobium mesophilum TaxID=392717 RepID=UPI000D1404A4|nr:hypothetical protein [Brumimicrobium mesophilum]
MKNFILSIVIAFGLGSVASAQTYNEGDNILNIGIGIGSAFRTGTSTLPPISASFEHGFTDKISAGGILAYMGSKEESQFGSTKYIYKYSYIILGLRGSYHFYNTDKIDAYGGATLGYVIGNSRVEIEGPNSFFTPQPTSVSGVAYGIHVGGKYYFNEKVGAFAELGYGMAILNLGITVKL